MVPVHPPWLFGVLQTMHQMEGHNPAIETLRKNYALTPPPFNAWTLARDRNHIQKQWEMSRETPSNVPAMQLRWETYREAYRQSISLNWEPPLA